MSDLLTDASKFLSYVLRHEPHAIGLALDSEGWAEVDSLIQGARGSGHQLDLGLIQAVVGNSGKKRFALSDDNRRIRALQGHSAGSVAIEHVAKEPPAILYHGTASRFLDSILAEGLRPGKRHHVHLSEDVATASEVGRRYGKPVVLVVEALRMHQQGLTFYQAENGVWLTDSVSKDFFSLFVGV